MIYFLDSTKVPFIISHAHHTYMLLFLTYTILSQSVLLVPSDWGIWASPPETDQDSCPGWLPPVPLDLVSPQEGFSPGPLTPRFKHFPATRILPITFVCFLCGTWHRIFMWNHCQLEEFINQRKIKFIPVRKFSHNIWGLYSQCTGNVFSCVFMLTVVGLVGVSRTDWEVLG